jgi:hypothetical protein
MISFEKIKLAVLVLVLNASCEIDKGDYLFINPDEPAYFEVTFENLVSDPMCGVISGDNGFTGAITAKNTDGSTSIYFNRTVNLEIISSSSPSALISPSTAENFIDGIATISSPAIQGLAGGANDISLKVTDSINPDITGTSTELTIDIPDLSYLQVTMPTNHIYSSDDSYTITVSAIDDNGSVYTNYDAQFDLVISNGTISPATARISSGGTVQVPVTISGATTNYTITATESPSTSQPSDATCMGGGGGDGSGGGGGGGGGGGELSIPDTLTCTLSAPQTTVYRGSNFNLNITITKTDQNGITYNTFNNTVDFASNPLLSISPSSKAISGTSSVGSPVTINGFGPFVISPDIGLNNTITATVNDGGLTTTCSTTVNVLGGVAIYGDNATELKAEFEAEPAFIGKTFLIVANTSIITANPNAFDGVIINKASTLYTGGTNLTASENTAIVNMNSLNIPVIVAADTYPIGAIPVSYSTIWGVTQEILIPPDQASCIFSAVNPLSTIPNSTINFYYEAQSDSFLYDIGKSTFVVEATVLSAGPYALILQTNSGTNAVLMGDAIYHTFHGNYSSNGGDETQWWESNRQLIIDILTWTFGW